MVPGNRRRGRVVAVGWLLLLGPLVLPGRVPVAADSPARTADTQPTAASVAVLGVEPAAAATARGDAPRKRIRDLGIVIGRMAPGPNNAITDVQGVRVGQVTIN